VDVGPQLGVVRLRLLADLMTMQWPALGERAEDEHPN
jgi:hypothetical protein